MSHTDIAKPRNIGIGAMATPLLIVGAMILLNGASDPTSSAADVQAPPSPESIIRPDLGAISDAQQAAMLFREHLPVLAESDSPFPLSTIETDEPMDSLGQEQHAMDPILVDASSFMVTAMMASNAGNIALINGKARRIGDELDGGWIITKIDAKAKHVTLKDADGELLTIGLHRPGSQFPGR